MIAKKEEHKLIIEFDQPWEREVAAWLFQTYGPDYFQKHLSKLLFDKQRAKKYMDIRSQVEDAHGTQS